VQLFVNANYDFLSVRKYAYAFSGALLLIGLFSVFFHRGLNYSIDFEGGLMMRVAFEQPVPVGELRRIVAEVSTKRPVTSMKRGTTSSGSSDSRRRKERPPPSRSRIC
jgi:SecD/SecF fusion protein